MDDRECPLRVTEQGYQRGHPLQRRVYRVLGTPGEDLPLDLALPLSVISAHGSAAIRSLSRSISRCAVASRSRFLATISAGARSTKDGLASFRSTASSSACVAARVLASRARSASTSGPAAVSSSMVT